MYYFVFELPRKGSKKIYKLNFFPCKNRHIVDILTYMTLLALKLTSEITHMTNHMENIC